ncbi:MAG: hypothetical protein M3Z35_05155 [Nitrospirota bacterium]|nr:hypothetical protein [Nitrospirota bacterium]
MEGDRQRNPDIHEGSDRAVCLFSFEVIEALQAEVIQSRRVRRGQCDACGIGLFSLKLGDQIGIGRCGWNWSLIPIRVYTMAVGFSMTGRVYARVLTEGLIGTDDPVTRELALPDSHEATFL